MGSLTTYRYSINNSIVTVMMILLLGAFFTSDIVRAYHAGDRFNFFLFAALLTVLAFVLTVVVIKRLIPSIKGATILEFDDQKITDHLRNITINWQDIKAINIERVRNAKWLIIDLKWESDHGSTITMSLRWVAGNDMDIYNNALAYFNKYSDPELFISEK